MTTLADLARQAADRLRARLSPEQHAALDATVLARHVLGWDSARWIAESRRAPSPDFESRFDALIARRMQGEPVAYITGTKEFWGLEFEVSPAVLIPRPETEILVEQALSIIDQNSQIRRVADIGTGSGCIAIAIAHSRPHVRVVATEISEAALDIAVRNAARHVVADRIEFLNTSGLEGVGAVDLVVSNPPYVATDGARGAQRTERGIGAPRVSEPGGVQGSPPESKDFEPQDALFGGRDGFDVIREILADVAKRKPVPPLLFEFGGDESGLRKAVSASRLAGPEGPRHRRLRLVKVVPDLAGIPRVALVEA